MNAFDRWFWPVMFWLQVATSLARSFVRKADRNGYFAAQRTENDKCALRGLVLLRGQQGEFVCVVPGSERTRVKP